MKELNELIGALAVESAKENKTKAFKTIIREIEAFYTENFFLGEYEVAIFLTNDEKTVLSFACPAYLVNSGMIPVSSTEAYTATIFRTGRGVIENNLQQQKHLGIFEIIRTPNDEIKPVWKMIGALIAVAEEKIGVIEISRRAVSQAEAAEDFSESDLMFLENTIAKLATFLQRVMPANFRGKIT
ncbi:MAG: GAF domain-containing protein [bacterium]|nr:GAF domain-containing protein [bacterium]